MRGDLVALNVWLELDASARDQSELLAELRAATAAGRPVLLAINEGPLRQLLAAAPDLPDYAVLQAGLAQPFGYVGAGIPPTPRDLTPDVPPAVLLNLGERQVLTHRFLEQALSVAIHQVDWTGAPPMVQANYQALSQSLVQNRLYELLTVVREGGLHVTMHQLLGLLARLLTGVYTTTERAGQHKPYYETAFEWRAENPLAATLAELDPASLPHAHLDTHHLWDDPVPVGTWLPGRRPTDDDTPGLATDATEALKRFRCIKQRFYFENELGDQVLRVLPPDRGQFQKLLEQARDAPDAARRTILAALARFAHQTGAASRASQQPGALSANTLYLWSGLRYDADRPPTVLVAGAKLPAHELAVQVPELLPAAHYLLGDYTPDHVRLAWGNPPTPQSPAMRIDLELWRDLASVQRGTPAERRPEQASRRVGRFLAALASALPQTPTAEVWVLNVATGRAELIQLEANTQAPNKLKYILADPNA
ncbi:hypothetical protein E5K00_12450 [Hymenobacter aquaticus]|uniref:Uncharacterized protein n=1 Tax=Hymenobacter aquaticus TaxID=1867101 RepID=A0A4Z0QB95_9BACT|nr:hypothetical protein [Hymenobacter aquaticus]TGE25962.1 hypothetical protein E5K00_12450 [Hymenobacter aquaticus]